jgi:hypothetical protein
LSLLDGPSLLLLALAVVACEKGRTWVSAGVLALAGLARETNLLGAGVLARHGGWRDWIRGGIAAALTVLPLLVWQDYLWSIYRGTSASAGVDHIQLPLVAYVMKWRVTLAEIAAAGWGSGAWPTLLVVVALTVQAGFLAAYRWWREPWWRLAVAFALLMFVVDFAVWDGHPGAVTRIALPLTFGFNVLLARVSRGFWIWYAAGNLHIIAALHMMPIPGLPPPF